MPTIRVSDIADLVVLLPYQLGFHPADSLVLADVTDGRLHGIARTDLVEVTRPELAAQCLRPLVCDGARSVVLAAWESYEGAATAAMDHACRAADELGLEVLREVVVRDGRLWSSGEGEPAEGRPVPEPTDVAGVADMVALGVAPLPGRDSLAGLVAPVPGERLGEVASAVETRRRCRRRSWSSPAARRDWRDYLLGAVTGASGPPTPHRVAVLSVALLDRDWRDALIAWLCTGSMPLEALPLRARRDLPGLPRIPRPPQRSEPGAGFRGAGSASGSRSASASGSGVVSGAVAGHDLGADPGGPFPVGVGRGGVADLSAGPDRSPRREDVGDSAAAPGEPRSATHHAAGGPGSGYPGEGGVHAGPGVGLGSRRLGRLRLVPGDDPSPFGGGPATWLLDPEESRAVLESLLALSRELPDDSEDVVAAALTVTAHVAWWLGDGALARTALERALTVCPGYRLAELLDTVVAVGIRPARLA